MFRVQSLISLPIRVASSVRGMDGLVSVLAFGLALTNMSIVAVGTVDGLIGVVLFGRSEARDIWLIRYSRVNTGPFLVRIVLAISP